MQSNYDYLISKCPWWLNKNGNIKAFYKAVSKLFDEIDRIYNLIEKQHLIDYASGEFLEDIGFKFNVARNGQNDNRYRNRIKLAMRKYKLIPNIETIENIGEMFTGIKPRIDLNTDGEHALYNVRFTANPNYDFTLVDEMELEQISGGGVKINVQNGVTNFDESYFSGDIYSDDLLFPFFSEKRTILLKE